MIWDEMAVVGRVARPHGLRGQVVVTPETDFPEERFQTSAQLFILQSGQVEQVTVTSVRFHRDRPVIGLAGVDDIDAASALSGAELRVPIDRLVALPEGTFYRHELIGCRVETRAGEAVGVVADVEGPVGGSCLIVETTKGPVMVPLAAAICPTIDPARRLVVIEPPDGLLELNRTSAS